VGRWAYAHGEYSLTVVLKVAGLPEPPDNEPSDTMPFLFPEKCMDLLGKVTELAEVTVVF
jgi:hypothetical protein